MRRSTGEVVDATTAIVPVGSTIFTPEDKERHQRWKERWKERRENAEIVSKELGKFAFVSANQQFEGLSPETTARLIYLSTFLKYNSDGLFRSQRTALTRAHLPELTGLSARTVSRFLDEVCPRYMYEDEDGALHMNPGIFRYGALSKSAELGSFQKIYMNAVRSLYRRTSTSNHRQLGYIFQMLPYINIEHNIICKNIFEKDLENIEFLTLPEFCKAVGYDYSTMARLKKIYGNIRVEVNGELEPFCAFVTAGGITKIFVNPHVIYSGSNYERVRILGCFCRPN